MGDEFDPTPYHQGNLFPYNEHVKDCYMLSIPAARLVNCFRKWIVFPNKLEKHEAHDLHWVRMPHHELVRLLPTWKKFHIRQAIHEVVNQKVMVRANKLDLNFPMPADVRAQYSWDLEYGQQIWDKHLSFDHTWWYAFREEEYFLGSGE